MLPTFDFASNYILEDEFVQLRPLTKDDYDLLLPFALNEPEIWKYSLITAAGAEGWKNYLNLALTAREEKKEYPFLVFDKRQQKYAGSTRFYDIQLSNQTLQLGYTWYGKDFQGTGLNKHCKFLLLEFAFEKMELERIEFRADYANKRSIAAMQSLGCTVEGILRNHLPKFDGGRRDSVILSILKDEWFATAKAALKEKLL
ncbi:MAG: GNAT family N-acetyltransferase [Janthinobacterium lividum]